ncbi:unnamed protein product [Rotaria sp. Silwood1]|nr:unnamed protein product [Rotaria sp. Silwood1]CAF3781422.1 unnamed protein product [Rotaria sp. Silwood1]CAF4649027.1 unnamed protein product [Rotaria sp. Silwood1]CAF4778465.1 unnamed protein product [Rotaria sp. Silwood1]
MNTNEIDNNVYIKTEMYEDFELRNDMSQEDPIINEHHRSHDHEITEKFNEHLRKGYRMLNHACSVCNCLLLRTPNHRLFCVGCNEDYIENKKTRNRKKIVTRNKGKDHIKRSKNQKKNQEHIENIRNCKQLQNKIKWAVNKLIKIQNPNRINEMCTVIIKLKETIEILKKQGRTSIKHH